MLNAPVPIHAALRRGDAILARITSGKVVEDRFTASFIVLDSAGILLILHIAIALIPIQKTVHSFESDIGSIFQL